jgi:hypothetical protein
VLDGSRYTNPSIVKNNGGDLKLFHTIEDKDPLALQKTARLCACARRLMEALPSEIPRIYFPAPRVNHHIQRNRFAMKTTIFLSFNQSQYEAKADITVTEVYICKFITAKG